MEVISLRYVILFLLLYSSPSIALDCENNFRYFKAFKLFHSNSDNYMRKFHFEMTERPKKGGYYKVLWKNNLPIEAKYFIGGNEYRKYKFDTNGRVILSVFNNTRRKCSVRYADKLVIDECKIDGEIVSKSIKKYNDTDLLIKFERFDKELNINQKNVYDYENSVIHSYDLSQSKTEYSSNKQNLSVYSRYNFHRSYLDDKFYINGGGYVVN